MILTKDKSFYKSLIALAVPIALQNFITFCVGLADNVMIGALGDAAISGVYMGSQVQTLLQIFGAGLEGAMLVLAAQYWGRRDTARISKIVSIGVRASAIFAALLSVICISAPRLVISLFSNEYSVIEAGAQYLRILAFSFIFYSITASLIAAGCSLPTLRSPTC